MLSTARGGRAARSPKNWHSCTLRSARPHHSGAILAPRHQRTRQWLSTGSAQGEPPGQKARRSHRRASAQPTLARPAPVLTRAKPVHRRNPAQRRSKTRQGGSGSALHTRGEVQGSEHSCSELATFVSGLFVSSEG